MIPAIPIMPKKPGQPLRVTILGRISTTRQDDESISSQHEDAERWLTQNYDGPTNLLRLGEQASGNLADRPSITEAREEVAAGRCDLVLVGELREIFRAPHLLWGFFYYCKDHGVRVIAVADNVDTADEHWETMLHFGALKAGLAVPEARRRVRRKAAYSFKKGGMVLKVRYGYKRLAKEEAESGAFGPKDMRIAKLPECTPVIRGMGEAVLRGESLEQIADRLNDDGVPPGPYVKSGRWTAAIVGNLLRNPILSGTRRFRVTVCVPVHTTGKTLRVRNGEPDEDFVPELAHLTEAEQAEVIAALDARARSRRARGSDNVLFGKPRSRTRWPGQSAVCGVCRKPMHANGTFLRCCRSTPTAGRECWNRVHAQIDVIRAKVLPWALGVLDALPVCRKALVEAAWKEYQRRRGRRGRAEAARDRRITALEAEAANLTAAIKKGGTLETLVASLAEVESALKAERAAREESLAEEEAGAYRSAAELEASLAEAIPLLAGCSTEFRDVLRQLLPVFRIVPVQALDCGQVRPRAELTLRAADPGGGPPTEVSASIDLFDPPAHIARMAECVAARRADPAKSLKRIATELGICEMTARRALDYAALMEREGLTDPYRVLTAKPPAASRWGRRMQKDRGADPDRPAA